MTGAYSFAVYQYCSVPILQSTNLWEWAWLVVHRKLYLADTSPSSLAHNLPSLCGAQKTFKQYLFPTFLDYVHCVCILLCILSFCFHSCKPFLIWLFWPVASSGSPVCSFPPLWSSSLVHCFKLQNEWSPTRPTFNFTKLHKWEFNTNWLLNKSASKVELKLCLNNEEFKTA